MASVLSNIERLEESVQQLLRSDQSEAGVAAVGLRALRSIGELRSTLEAQNDRPARNRAARPTLRLPRAAGSGAAPSSANSSAEVVDLTGGPDFRGQVTVDLLTYSEAMRRHSEEQQRAHAARARREFSLLCLHTARLTNVVALPQPSPASTSRNADDDPHWQPRPGHLRRPRQRRMFSFLLVRLITNHLEWQAAATEAANAPGSISFTGPSAVLSSPSRPGRSLTAATSMDRQVLLDDLAQMNSLSERLERERRAIARGNGSDDRWTRERRRRHELENALHMLAPNPYDRSQDSLAEPGNDNSVDWNAVDTTFDIRALSSSSETMVVAHASILAGIPLYHTMSEIRAAATDDERLDRLAAITSEYTPTYLSDWGNPDRARSLDATAPARDESPHATLEGGAARRRDENSARIREGVARLEELRRRRADRRAAYGMTWDTVSRLSPEDIPGAFRSERTSPQLALSAPAAPPASASPGATADVPMDVDSDDLEAIRNAVRATQPAAHEGSDDHDLDTAQAQPAPTPATEDNAAARSPQRRPLPLLPTPPSISAPLPPPARAGTSRNIDLSAYHDGPFRASLERTLFLARRREEAEAARRGTERSQQPSGSSAAQARSESSRTQTQQSVPPAPTALPPLEPARPPGPRDPPRTSGRSSNAMDAAATRIPDSLWRDYLGPRESVRLGGSARNVSDEDIEDMEETNRLLTELPTSTSQPRTRLPRPWGELSSTAADTSANDYDLEPFFNSQRVGFPRLAYRPAARAEREAEARLRADRLEIEHRRAASRTFHYSPAIRPPDYRDALVSDLARWKRARFANIR